MQLRPYQKTILEEAKSIINHHGFVYLALEMRLGKEVTKEEFRELMLKRVAQQKEVKKLSKTEFGREILRQKGIKPID